MIYMVYIHRVQYLSIITYSFVDLHMYLIIQYVMGCGPIV